MGGCVQIGITKTTPALQSSSATTLFNFETSKPGESNVTTTTSATIMQISENETTTTSPTLNVTIGSLFNTKTTTKHPVTTTNTAITTLPPNATETRKKKKKRRRHYEVQPAYYCACDLTVS